MPYFSINLFYDLPGTTFRQQDVLQQLKEAFSDAQIDWRDQYQVSLDRALQFPAAPVVITTMRRNLAEQGPAFAFTFTADRCAFRGTVKRHLISILYDATATAVAKRQVRDFLLTILPAGGILEEG